MDETGPVGPPAFRGRVRQHGDEAEVVRLPALRNVEHVEIALCAATPIQGHLSFESPLQGALAHRLDRREAGAARHHHDRLVRLLAQEKRAERAFEAQQVADFQAAEDLVGEGTSRRVAHVELERGDAFGPRRIGDRVAAPLSVLQQEVDVLAGKEAEVLVHRQAQIEDRDVRRRTLDFLDPAGNLARPDARHARELVHLDDDIGERFCLAKQGIALRLVAVGKIGRMHRTVIDLAFEQGAAAGAADAGAAAVRHHEAGIEPGLQDALPFRHLEAVSAWFESDAVSHLQALY